MPLLKLSELETLEKDQLNMQRRKSAFVFFIVPSQNGLEETKVFILWYDLRMRFHVMHEKPQVITGS